MRLVLALAITLAAARAAAHAVPSVSDNNRYLKVTPLADRIRLAYTVFYGDVPGAGLRRTIDANRDGAIDDAERRAFGDQLGRALAPALELTVDGRRQPVVWSQIVVGMSVTATAAGAFSVDLIASFCLAPPRGTHTMLLRDRFKLDHPGETEVKVEDSRGVKVDRARIGQDDELGDIYKIIGPGGPMEDDGLDLQFTAGEAAIAGDAACATPREMATAIPTRAIVGAAAVIAFVLAAAVALVRRRRR